MGRNEQDATAAATVLLVDRGERLENLEVEDGFLDRDGDELLSLEPQGPGDVLLRHRGKLDGAHDDARARDADAHLALAQPQPPPQPLDRRAHGAGVDDLSFAHRIGRQRDLAERAQDRGGCHLDLGDPARVGPDVEPDHAPGHELSLSSASRCSPWERRSPWELRSPSELRTTRLSRYAARADSRMRKGSPARGARISPALMSR